MKESTVKWLKAAGIRAAKTFAQASIAAIGTSYAIGDVDWLLIVSIAGLSAILSVLTSVAGLPEAPAPDSFPTVK
jgi:hypothetical protein